MESKLQQNAFRFVNVLTFLEIVQLLFISNVVGDEFAEKKPIQFSKLLLYIM